MNDFHHDHMNEDGTEMKPYNPKFPPWFTREDQAEIVRLYLESGYEEKRIRFMMAYTEEEYQDLLAIAEDVD